MQGFWLAEFVCRKAVKSRSLSSYFSFQVLLQLTILGEHLSNSIHGGKTIIFHHPTSQIHHHHLLPLLTLCGRRVKQSQTVRSGRFKSNLFTWPGRPNTTHGDRRLASPTRLFSFLSGLWIRVTHLDYKNPCHSTSGCEPSCTRIWPHVNPVQRGWK